MSDIPDSVSLEKLLQQVRKLRNDKGLPPKGTVLPPLPLSGPGTGMLDLTVVLEQIISDAAGVGMIQMMHLTSYLLDAIISGLVEEVDRHKQQRDAVSQGVAIRASADVALLKGSQALLHSLLEPLTNHLGARQMAELLFAGQYGPGIQRRVVISDTILDALGINRSEFDAYFEENFLSKD
jgi:hypothetical protein